MINKPLVYRLNPLIQASLVVDCDPLAERLVVIDRNNMNALIHVRVNGTFKSVVPVEYGSTSSLIVFIIDDDGVYNIAALDGVRAKLFDAWVDTL